MSYTTYYSTAHQKTLSAYEVKRHIGLDPNTYGSAGLLRAGVYSITQVDNPHDTGLYDVTLSYTVSGDYAVQSWSKTDKPLDEAKTYAYKRLKEQFEVDAKALAGDWGLFALIAIAGKTSSPATPEETSVFSDLKTLFDTLTSNLSSVESASDVDTINSIIN